MSTAWITVIVGCVIIYAILQWAMTRRHARNLDRHEEEMRKIYEKHR